MKTQNRAAVAVLMLFVGPITLFWAMDSAESQPTTLTSQTDLLLDKPLSDFRTFLPWNEAVSILERLVSENQAIPIEGPGREDARTVLRSALEGGFLTSRKVAFPLLHTGLMGYLKIGPLAEGFFSEEKRRMPFYRRGLALSAGPAYKEFLLFFALLIRTHDYGFAFESQLLSEAAKSQLEKVNYRIGRTSASEVSSSDEQARDYSGAVKKDYLMRAMAYAVLNIFNSDPSGRTYSFSEMEAAADFFGYLEASETQRIQAFYANRASWPANVRAGVLAGVGTAGLLTLWRWIGHIRRPFDPSFMTSFSFADNHPAIQFVLTAIPSIAVGVAVMHLHRGLFNPFWTEDEPNRFAGTQDLCRALLNQSHEEIP